jgi:hypothetical protein
LSLLLLLLLLLLLWLMSVITFQILRASERQTTLVLLLLVGGRGYCILPRPPNHSVAWCTLHSENVTLVRGKGRIRKHIGKSILNPDDQEHETTVIVTLSVSRLSCCWPSLAQSFLAAASSRAMIKIFERPYPRAQCLHNYRHPTSYKFQESLSINVHNIEEHN